MSESNQSSEKGIPTGALEFERREVVRSGRPVVLSILMQEFALSDGSRVWRDVPIRRPDKRQQR